MWSLFLSEGCSVTWINDAELDSRETWIPHDFTKPVLQLLINHLSSLHLQVLISKMQDQYNLKILPVLIAFKTCIYYLVFCVLSICKLHVSSMELGTISNASSLYQLYVGSVPLIIDFWSLLIDCYDKVTLTKLPFYKCSTGWEKHYIC